MADIAQQPSFLNSVASGIAGWVKGLVAGGTVGALAGATAGALVGIFAGPGGVLAGAGFGALIGGSTFAGLGAAAGTVTGVVRSREAAAPSAEDIVGVAKISFAQGMAAGAHLSQELDETTKFRDKIMKERGIVVPPKQVN